MDEDREGESISWHLLQLLEQVPVKRMVFHEITEEAIKRALGQTRELNMELVHAQETRRILDRLVGYGLAAAVEKGGLGSLRWPRAIGSGAAAGAARALDVPSAAAAIGISGPAEA